jgi:gamma-glutamylcyclotransferase (GGCT)/AIG2-like uncharacterized protein YtfP
MTGEVRLFVYGSLKRGGAHAAEMAGAAFLGSAVTAPGYGLWRVGDYPALCPASGGTVTGELYLVSPGLLRELDAFEGCPELYRRIEIRLSTGEPAQAYAMGEEAIVGAPQIERGTWPVEG